MFTDVDWSHRGEYMFNKHGVAMAQANEALRDPERLVLHPGYNSRSGKTDRVIGYSHSADCLPSIIVLDDHGHEYGVNGWKANAKGQTIYREAKES